MGSTFHMLCPRYRGLQASLPLWPLGYVRVLPFYLFNVKIHFASSGSSCKDLRLTLMHSERPKLHRVLAVLSAIGLNV